ncbi:MAG: fumarylacetoacetase [Bacteroidales bacterium]
MKRLTSWLPIPEHSDFPLENLPFGVIRNAYLPPRVATRIGDTIVDLAFLAESGFFSTVSPELNRVFHKDNLNDFIALGKPVWNAFRTRLQEIFSENNAELKDKVVVRSQGLYACTEVEMLLPVKIGDYTDFYSSIEHATNVGIMFRDPNNALLPNWKHLPVAYHGRSSSIVVSGTNLHRPKGQLNPTNTLPEFSPSQNMDFELEMAFIVGQSNPLGKSVSTREAEDHIFGMVIFNDLSARDIQRWEYVPLGPFLSKNFGSVASPWVITMDALEPFRTLGPEQDVQVLPYLEFEGDKNFDINLEVWIQPKNAEAKLVCQSNYKYLYWNMCQQLAHHTINGCNLKIGDLCASGTISGPAKGSYGSLLEITWNGKEPIEYSDGKTRTFLEDHDTIVMKAFAEKDGLRIGFGESRTTILPAIE